MKNQKFDDIMKKYHEDLTDSDRKTILLKIRELMDKLWNPPYREDQNGNWRVEYLKSESTLDYIRVLNDSNHPNITFNHVFEVFDMKRIMQMCINAFIRNDPSGKK